MYERTTKNVSWVIRGGLIFWEKRSRHKSSLLFSVVFESRASESFFHGRRKDDAVLLFSTVRWSGERYRSVVLVSYLIFGYLIFWPLRSELNLPALNLSRKNNWLCKKVVVLCAEGKNSQAEENTNLSWEQKNVPCKTPPKSKRWIRLKYSFMFRSHAQHTPSSPMILSARVKKSYTLFGTAPSSFHLAAAAAFSLILADEE